MTSTHCLRILLPLAFALSASAQTSQVTVKPPAKVVVKRGETFTVKVGLEVVAGFHVHSNKPNDEYLIPTRLTWTSDSLEVVAVEYPKAKIEQAEFSKKPLAVYDGQFEILTRFTSKAGAAPGIGMATGKLRYQSCNDRMCFPPKTVDVKLSYDLQ